MIHLRPSDKTESAREPWGYLCELERAGDPSIMASISVSVGNRGGELVKGKKEEISSRLYLQLPLRQKWNSPSIVTSQLSELPPPPGPNTGPGSQSCSKGSCLNVSPAMGTSLGGERGWACAGRPLPRS